VVASPYPFVSAIFPNWNGKNDSLECLESIRCLEYPLERLEVIVVDNGSTDGSLPAIADKLAHLEREGLYRGILVNLPNNVGPVTACNAGLKQTDQQAEYILKLDNDVVLQPEYVRTLIEIASEAPEIGAISGRVVYYDTPERTAHGAGYLNWWLGRYTNQDKADITDCAFVTGCGCLISKSAIEKSEQFLDEDYFLYHDDVDLCLRLAQIGYRITYVPSVSLAHKVSASTKGKGKSAFAIYYEVRNRLILMQKHAPSPQREFFFGVYAHFMVLTKIARARTKAEVKSILQAVGDFREHRWGYQDLR
jgi:GT2 family glycosyltransferase